MENPLITENTTARILAAMQFMESWLEFKNAGKIEPSKNSRGMIATSSGRAYTHVWKAWAIYLDGLGLDFTRAGPAEVINFVQHQVRPNSNRAEVASPVTKARYTSLLKWIYAHALRRGMVLSNPVLEIDFFERPRKEFVANRRIAPGVWDALHAALPPTPAGNPFVARDHAICTLFCALGLTIAEMVDLRVHQLHRSRRTQVDYRGNDLPGSAVCRTLPNVIIINKGSRPSQCRTLLLPSAATHSLLRWLAVRDQLLATRALGCATHLRLHDQVFITRFATPMSPRPLLKITSTHLLRAFKLAGQAVPPGMGLGGMVFRNEIIAQLFHGGASATAVAKMMGLKNEKSLTRFNDRLPDSPVLLQ